MTDETNPPDKPKFLDGLKDPDPRKWKEAWQSAQIIEEEREAWIREKISRATKSEK
ncbi:hypothetical protein [Primorskyibacter sp. 2E233]|uniref:hypothetical protein n=1 Tax=Primorskyibacter sp. 2E233 TaxID=3413431 RepID=UPI003BF191E4